MGKELEYKLHIDSPERLAEVLADAEIAALTDGEWRETPMKTTYYDTPNRDFAALKWTLRCRREGERYVVCVKTPQSDAHTRGEFQVEARQPDEAAVEKLIRVGAPERLLLIYARGTPVPICGAEFIRRSVMLRFSDGSTAELAGDVGYLSGREERIAFTELELELYSGKPDAMLALLERLRARYALHEEPLSKFARARQLK